MSWWRRILHKTSVSKKLPTIFIYKQRLVWVAYLYGEPFDVAESKEDLKTGNIQPGDPRLKVVRFQEVIE